MKRILIFVLVLFCAINSKAQGFPLTQNLGSSSTLVQVPANGGLMAGLINRSFLDTTAANLTYLKAYAGAQILTTSDTSLWFRNQGANMWVKYASAAGGASGGYWALTGNYLSSFPATLGVGTNSTDNLPFKTNNTRRIILPSTGLGYKNDTTNNKVMTWNSSTLEWGYGSWFGGAKPAGNYGNIQINRNGLFATPSSDSLTFINGHLTTSSDALIRGVSVGTGGTIYRGTVLGEHAGQSVALYDNTAVGYYTLNSSTGIQNSGFGSESLYSNTTGQDNTGVGVFTLQSNTIGNNNTAVGSSAMIANISGIDNTGIGFRALNQVAANHNTSVGSNSLYELTTGSYNTAIGDSAGINLVYGSNNTIIGARAAFPTNDVNNNILISDGAGVVKIKADSTGSVYLPFLESNAGTKQVRIDPSTGKLSYTDTSAAAISYYNSNVGSAYRLAIPNTNNIKTLSEGYSIILDSATTNQIGFKVDSSSSGLSAYFLRRNDSLTSTNPLGYVTKKILADTASAIRSAIPAATTYYNSNVGSAYRLAVPNTNNIKTLSAGNGMTLDSATTNQIGFKVDTSTISTKANVLSQLTGYVPTSRTLTGGYGINTIGDLSTNRTITVDSATLSSYYLRRKDSLTATNTLGYVTKKILADTASAIRSAIPAATSPAGNYGNLQINRNGLFATPASDSLTYTTAGGLAVKNIVTTTVGATFNSSNSSTGDINIKGQTDNNLLFADVSQNNIGIGTGTPSSNSKLHLLVGNLDGLKIESSNSGYLEIGKTSSTRYRFANDYSLAGTLEILYGNNTTPSSSRLTIQSNGNIGIATTVDAGYKLDVNGTGRFTTNLYVTGASGNGLTINGTNPTITTNGDASSYYGGYTHTYLNNSLYFSLGTARAGATYGGYLSSKNVTSGVLSVYLGVAAAAGAEIYNGSTASINILTIYGASGQSGDYTKWVDYSGNTLMVLKSTGNFGIGTASPNSTLNINGSFAKTYISKAVDYTATSSDCVIDVTATGKTITLPTAVGITGRQYTIKLTASGTGTIATTTSQTIDGSSTYSLSAQYKYVTVVSNGSNWIITANN